jgi:hypothetical protein
MRSTLSHAVVALTGAIVGVMLWSGVRDAGWIEYQAAAQHLRSEASLRTGNPDPLTRPDWDPSEICVPLGRVTGLRSKEIAWTVGMLGEKAIYTVDHDRLKQSWAELGLLSHMRIAMLGLSREDLKTINASFDTNEPLQRAAIPW